MSNQTDVAAVLEQVALGQPTAEEEAAELEKYFVETPQWGKVQAGEVDIIYGAKGSGKSAIYSLLTKRSAELSKRNITLVSGENLRGSTVFEQLSTDPPTSEQEFRYLWKLYLLTVLAEPLRKLDSQDAKDVVSLLEDAELLEPEAGLEAKLRAVSKYVKRLLHLESVEGGVKVDQVTGMPSGFSGKITLREPSYSERKLGLVSVDSMLAQTDSALTAANQNVWVLLDRLDNAFFEHPELENGALRALFRVYIDFTRFNKIDLKIFLRTDIWRRLTQEGFREASHINRSVTLQWNEDSLLNLLIERFLNNKVLLERYKVERPTVLASRESQEDFFYRVFPAQVDSGSNRPKTFDWMLNHISDGTESWAPRELIQLVTESREAQITECKLGVSQVTGELLFSSSSIKNAMPKVSEARYSRTLCAEYPKLKEHMDKLEGAKTEQSLETLQKLWGLPSNDCAAIAKSLVEIGFFQKKTSGKSGEVTYWVPLLYRDALNMVQGREKD